MRRLLALLILLAPTIAQADITGRRVSPVLMIQGSVPQTLINNLSLDATRTITIANTGGYSVAALGFKFTRNSATTVDMSCVGYLVDGGEPYVLQSTTDLNGVATSNDRSWTKPVAVSASWPWRVDIAGFRKVVCFVTSTGGGASDLLTVKGHLVAVCGG
jgi:hypothetical protein